MNLDHIKFIVVHCTDSPHGRGDDASSIHRWHMENGWDGIGYHRVILEDGTIEHGRPLYWKGAHVGPFNRVSLGIVMFGRGEYTPDQWYSLPKAIHELIALCPKAVVVGHNDLDKSKECPMFDVKAWWQDL